MAEVFDISLPNSDSRLAGAVCCFGVFDGVHIGHQALIERTIEVARNLGRKAVIVTFSCDPDELFHPDSLKKIMSNEQRLQALANEGADYVAVFPFSREFASLEPEEFLDRAFLYATPHKLFVGPDFRFGARAAGSLDELSDWGSDHGMDVESFDLVTYEAVPVTATRIRSQLLGGELQSANTMLGRPFSIEGIVEAGRGEGGSMGFKTANLSFDTMHHVLLDGVYAGYAHVQGALYKAAISMGVSPTFSDRATSTCEVHILHFEGDLYGTPMRVEFTHRLRPMIKFESVDELIQTVMGDIAWVDENL